MMPAPMDPRVMPAEISLRLQPNSSAIGFMKTLSTGLKRPTCVKLDSTTTRTISQP